MTDRQLELVKLLENNGSLTIRELSQNLYISESTVRRDLAALEKANLIARTDQGIIALKRDHGGVSLSYSLKTYEKEKRLIAREAVKLVEDKSTIFLSSASTTMFMIPLLARKNKLTIITDGLEHALKAASLGIKTICIGGVVIPSGKRLPACWLKRCSPACMRTSHSFLCRTFRLPAMCGITRRRK